MFYHVLINTKREGKSVYRHVKTYQQMGSLTTYLIRQGKPVWVVSSENHLLPNFNGDGEMYGGFPAAYWNGGSGWSQAVIPSLPIVRK